MALKNGDLRPNRVTCRPFLGKLAVSSFPDKQAREGIPVKPNERGSDKEDPKSTSKKAITPSDPGFEDPVFSLVRLSNARGALIGWFIKIEPGGLGPSSVYSSFLLYNINVHP
jgi:hypothetical protein